MTIFNAIINNNYAKVKEIIEAKEATADLLEPVAFVGQDGVTAYRHHPKTAIQVAETLGRDVIPAYLLGSKVNG